MPCMYCPPARKPRTVRTVIISVLSTAAAIFIMLAVLGTAMPAAQPCIVNKSTTIKFSR